MHHKKTITLDLQKCKSGKIDEWIPLKSEFLFLFILLKTKKCTMLFKNTESTGNIC